MYIYIIHITSPKVTFKKLENCDEKDFDKMATELALNLTPKVRRDWKTAIVNAPQAVIQDWKRQSGLGFGQGTF